MLSEFYADLHIHIGRTWKGKPVKITGSKSLTLENILHTATMKKGLDIVGVIDCHSPEVLEEMAALIKENKLVELPGGGLRYQDTTLIPGVEIEVNDENCLGPLHVLAFFKSWQVMREFSTWMQHYITNINLSTQRIACDAVTLQNTVHELGGLFIPAHVFTPFKSAYGKGVKKSLAEVFDMDQIDAIELGLSSDTDMVKGISELANYTFVTNSDAHSLGKMAREYQKIRMQEPTFDEFQKALKEEDGREIIANYGLNPLLGKYHETACSDCGYRTTEVPCPNCGGKHLVKGVAVRIKELTDTDETLRERPPYIHQIPLDFIPGIGKKTMEKLLISFGTEMAILHEVSKEDLEKVVPLKIAELIDKGRNGRLSLSVGGGGTYGKIKSE
ncbi:endonuclease Q family protein [Rummeliibacillus pycnus]|uniref:endonuclease Q family protein n=1 Tax=Rummeliibacillus pycnus TaxID=101070 RepID=UPI0037CB07B6